MQAVGCVEGIEKRVDVVSMAMQVRGKGGEAAGGGPCMWWGAW